jgi:hypothetical protein
MSVHFFSFLPDYELNTIYSALGLYMADITYMETCVSPEYTVKKQLSKEEKDNVLKINKMMKKIKMEMKARITHKKSFVSKADKWLEQLEKHVKV